MSEHLAVLEKARDLVAAGFVGDCYAVDALARPVLPTDPNAVRFCLIGAVVRAADFDNREMGRALAALKRVCHHPQHHSRQINQAGAVRVFDQAIYAERRRLDPLTPIETETSDD